MHLCSSGTKWIKDIGIRPETLHLIEDNVSLNLHHVGLGSDFLNKTSKAQEIKAIINKWDGLKLKNFFSAKDTIKNVKGEPAEWEKIYSTHTSDRALISKIYKELTKPYNKNTKNPINKWAKELNRHFTEDRQEINEYIRKCSTSLVLEKCKLKQPQDFILIQLE